MYNRIALLRGETGLSRKQLAERLNVNPQTIGYLERGDYSPSLELGMKLARIFDVRVETLFSLDPFESVAEILDREGD
jgi:DNA-binding XRE family transcriptional regulator